MPPKVINWSPHPGRQTDFLASPAFEVLYGGAAGGGKTEALLMGAVYYVNEPDYHAIIFRRKYPDIERTLIPRSMKYYRGLGGQWNGTTRCWHWPSGAMVRFAHLQHEDTVYDHQSAEYQYMGFDEVAEFSRFQYDFMKTRVRGTNPNVCLQVRAGTNPIGKGKQWLKKKFVTGLIPMQLYRNPRTNTTQQFIPALLEDNPSLFKGDPGYATRLEGMEDQALAKALRWGDWSGLEGQYFDEFDLERDDKPYHRIPVEMPRELDQVFGSMDWGHSPDAFCYHLHLVRKIPWEAGYFLRVITFAEIYGFKKHPAEWADIIRNLEGTFKVVMRYGDPSAWNKDPKGGSSIAEEFLDKGIPFVKANNDRHQGWQAMRVWLGKAPDGLPYWQICSCCKNLINQIPDLERDPLDSFDVLEGGEDHAPDSARYFLISRPMNIAQPTPAKKIQGVTLTVNELLAMGKETKVTSVGQFAVKQ